MSLGNNSEAANFNAKFHRLAPRRAAFVGRWRRGGDSRLACFLEPATDNIPNQQSFVAVAQVETSWCPPVHYRLLTIGTPANQAAHVAIGTSRRKFMRFAGRSVSYRQIAPCSEGSVP
jgi:hypothetical protein